ncbi:class I SAM-dependent methyltransferase [Haliangium sp.]|uniref:class I SAM-dependent methyltransferase n=1 Tax=Haliangium sp. TaxID=2663208 RepID=UPI003D1435B5
MDPRAYYDDFAAWYERERGQGYHRMLDDLEVGLVERFGRDRRVLEVGCGTGLILARVGTFAAEAVGVDLSRGMLTRARERGLTVVQGSATALPFADACFDVTCSFKVLPHVPDIRAALAEMARVTRPGGHVLAEFYNPVSLRWLVKKLKSPSAVSATITDDAVYTRYDTISRIRGYLPPSLAYETVRGIRILTPVAALHRVPGLGSLVRAAEAGLADVPGARALAGFVVLVARRR